MQRRRRDLEDVGEQALMSGRAPKRQLTNSTVAPNNGRVDQEAPRASSGSPVSPSFLLKEISGFTPSI
jgi:hypothetical protein